MGIFQKLPQLIETQIDSYLEKAKTSKARENEEYQDRKSIVDFSHPENDQQGYKEKQGLVGNGVLKNMARKDSIIISIINTKLAQIHPFTQYQKDKYSPGWVIEPDKQADISEEDKLSLANPELDDEARDKLRFELDKKRLDLKNKQNDEIAKIKSFVQNCGMPADETDTTHRRWDLPKYVASIVYDRLVYFYSATELIPSKGGDKVHHFYPVCAGTIKYVSEESAAAQLNTYKDLIVQREKHFQKRFDAKKPFKYVQVVRGVKVAAFTEDEMIFEAPMPTTDPEDNGYSMGELEMLIQIVTAHLYAEAHNRNFFTQGLGTKGILHIKGDNISRGQLEAFKRQWFNQVINTRNAFRPPIIGMAEDVKWVELAQSNKDMEFDNWMNYLIKVACAIYQIDPSEINFDISKTNTSTLQEANNEEKLKASKDKGLRPLLDYVENIFNNHILMYWNPGLAKKYKFKFVGFDAESRKAEQERLTKEVAVWKTINEARIEMGYPPIEDGDIVGNAIYSQYKAQKLQQSQMDEQGMEDPNAMNPEDDQDAQANAGIGEDLDSLAEEISGALSDQDKDIQDEEKQKEKEAQQKAKDAAKKSNTPDVVEYYLKDEE